VWNVETLEQKGNRARTGVWEASGSTPDMHQELREAERRADCFWLLIAELSRSSLLLPRVKMIQRSLFVELQNALASIRVVRHGAERLGPRRLPHPEGCMGFLQRCSSVMHLICMAPPAHGRGRVSCVRRWAIKTPSQPPQPLGARRGLGAGGGVAGKGPGSTSR
jgi:hypothetical protein